MRLFPALIMSLVAAPALAAPWKIDPASTLTFTGKQASEPFTGSFRKFTPTVEFDPANPQTATITVTVDMASATIENDKDKQESLPTADWFDTAKFPVATFTSTNVSQVGRDTNTFMAEGNLTIHGISKKIQLPFSFTEHNGVATVDGSIPLNRSDFAIGSGQWKSDEWIAYPVEVKFHLMATKG